MTINHFSTNNNPDRSYQANAAWKTYTDAQNGFSFQYPPELTPVTDAPDSHLYYYLEPMGKNNRIYFSFPISYTSASTTGILSALMSFDDMQTSTSTCNGFTNEKFLAPEHDIQSEVTINNLTFNKHEILDSCGAGMCAKHYQYSIVKNDLCYQADLTFLDGAAPLDTTTPPDVAYAESNKTEAALQAIFQRMLSTLTFTH